MYTSNFKAYSRLNTDIFILRSVGVGVKRWIYYILIYRYPGTLQSLK